MKYCTKCGKEIMDEAVVCPGCGCPTDNTVWRNMANRGEDKANVGLIVLSILIPIVGVILWPVNHKETPKAAMTYGLCGIISWVVFGVLLFALRELYI